MLTPSREAAGGDHGGDWAEVRRLQRVEGLPIKEFARQMGLARNTVRAAWRTERPPRHERQARGSVVDAYEPAIRSLLATWPRMPSAVIAQRIDRQVHAIVAAFTCALATRIKLAPPRDPEFKSLVERADGYLETTSRSGSWSGPPKAAARSPSTPPANRPRSWSPRTCRSGPGAETFAGDVAAAMIHRLVHHAEVLTLSGDSYRTRTRRELLSDGRSRD